MVCNRGREPETLLLCKRCGLSYDKAAAKDTTALALIAWTAKRVRYYAGVRRGPGRWKP